MINLELYRIFFTVANVGNITKASKLLNISQPAITKHIKNLEDSLKMPLFIRTKKGVVLNECGQKIFLNVKQALILFDEIDGMLKEYSDLNVGTIKIGTSTTLMRKFLMPYIEKFHENYPKITFDIYTDPTKELIMKLKNGQVDLIIGKLFNNFDRDLQYQELGKTKYIFVANKKYFHFPKKILAKDLEKYPIILQEYPSNSRISANAYFKNNNVMIKPALNIASSNLMVDFINIGYGIGYVTELYIKDELKNEKLYALDVYPETEEISFGVISLKNNVLSNCCKKFIDHLSK